MPSSDPADFLKHFGTRGIAKSAPFAHQDRDPEADASYFGVRGTPFVVRKEHSDNADFLKHFGVRGLLKSAPYIRRDKAQALARLEANKDSSQEVQHEETADSNPATLTPEMIEAGKAWLKSRGVC